VKRGLAILLLVAAAAPLTAAQGSFEKAISIPPEREAALGWSPAGCNSAEETRVSTRIRTIEAADAPKVRLRAAIIPK
jgi:hypothetical protein